MLSSYLCPDFKVQKVKEVGVNIATSRSYIL